MLRLKLDEIIQEVSIEQLIKDAELRYGDRFEKPESLITIIEGVKEYVYINFSGLSAVFGKQKARKTFYLSILMSAAVSGDVIDDKFRGYAKDSEHFWFDTEQSKYYANRNNYRVVKKIGLKNHPDNFRLLSLKRYCVEDRIKVIEHMIDKSKSPGLVIIDGTRDLVYDFNNLEECTKLINWEMSLVDRTGCHILNVLHINPLKKGDEEKPRGHLGTELQNKVEASMMVEKSKEDKSVSIITPRDFRDKDVKKLGMSVDEHGIPSVCELKEEFETKF